jgi:osmotically-inducible protein OsmY
MTIDTSIDLDVQTLVLEELKWTPDVDAAGIGVAVEDGTVTLSGEVDSYAERLAAKKAARRIRGVRTVVDDLTVHAASDPAITETVIAREVERALRGASNVPESVQAEIQGRNVTLTGEVDWEFQRRAAKRAVQFLRGVRSVNSMIRLSARPSAADAEERIRNALTRNAQLDGKTIQVSVDGTRATLTGTVRSWVERQQAENAAWASPHVTKVDNGIVVRPV